MSNTVTGTVHHIGPIESVGSNGFTKRLLVVNNGQQYDNLTPIELKKDKTALADGLRVGQSVTVHVNVGGREYSGKYYSSITGWKIEASAPPQNQSAPPQNQSAPPRAVSAPPAEEDVDLPF